MTLPLAEVYEVATFYRNFDVIEDGEAAPPEVTVRVCDSLSCEMAGSEALIDGMKRSYNGRVRVTHGACMGRCDSAPVVRLKDNYIEQASVEKVREPLTRMRSRRGFRPIPGSPTTRASGGYGVLRDCLTGKRTPESVIEALDAGGLRGLGGAGFPTGRKWKFVRAEPGPRLMAVNADESEPGTFKDRHYLLKDPHRFLEGMLIAAWAVEADDVYIYLRDEYPQIRADPRRSNLT